MAKEASQMKRKTGEKKLGRSADDVVRFNLYLPKEAYRR